MCLLMGPSVCMCLCVAQPQQLLLLFPQTKKGLQSLCACWLRLQQFYKCVDVETSLVSLSGRLAGQFCVWRFGFETERWRKQLLSL